MKTTLSLTKNALGGSMTLGGLFLEKFDLEITNETKPLALKAAKFWRNKVNSSILMPCFQIHSWFMWFWTKKALSSENVLKNGPKWGRSPKNLLMILQWKRLIFVDWGFEWGKRNLRTPTPELFLLWLGHISSVIPRLTLSSVSMYWYLFRKDWLDFKSNNMIMNKISIYDCNLIYHQRQFLCILLCQFWHFARHLRISIYKHYINVSIY